MNMVQIISVLAVVIGIVAQAGFFTQAYKIIKAKEIKGVSISTYFLFLPNVVIWCLYGIVTNQITIVIPNVAAIIGCLSVIVLYYRYKNYINTEAADIQ